MWLLLAALPAGAEELSLGRVLTEEIAFGQAFDDAEALCREKAEQYDVEKTVAGTPDLLGGIQPADPEWVEAKALYTDMLKAGCWYDKAAAAEAYAHAFGTALSRSDLEALIAFYRSDLGGKYREASLQANVAANRASEPLGDPDAAYATFGQALGGILARRSPPPESLPLASAAQALESADAAVALSDRIMQGVVAGRGREALALARKHTIVPDAKIDALIEQIEQQKPVIASRFGRSLDSELLRNDTIGDSLIRTVFLHRFENHAMVWLFTWYRGDEGWLLSSLRFADDPSLLFN